MSMFGLNPRGALLGVVALVVAACGGSPSASLSPLGPSAGPTIAAAGGSSITGTVIGEAAPAAELMAFDAGQAAIPVAAGTGTAGVTVTMAGTGESQDAGPDGTFVFENVPPGTIELRFSGPGVDARAVVTIESDEDVRVEVHVSGPEADLHVTDRRRRPKVEIEGLIAALDEVAQTIDVNGQVVGVTETTLIRHGNRTFAFADLAVGDRVHVRGSVDAGTGIVVAREIKLQSAGDGNGDDDGDDDANGGGNSQPPGVHAAEVSGVVSGLTGTCPALTFEVEATVVTADADTVFRDGTCADVVDGASVEVKGTVAEDASVTATRVELKSSTGGGGDDDNGSGGHGRGGRGHGGSGALD